MTARNCWTCAHDEQRQTAGGYVYHVCGAVWTAAVAEWIEHQVAPAAPGVPPSMPPRDAPPCPKWSPNLAESGPKEAE
jgi:hypothetical protein